MEHEVCTLQTSMGAVRVSSYGGEWQLPAIMALVGRDLSEPYSVFTYRYFLDGWPQYCLLAHAPAPAGAVAAGGAGGGGGGPAAGGPAGGGPAGGGPAGGGPAGGGAGESAGAEVLVGAILCKASTHKSGRTRGYVGMFAVDTPYRRCGIGSQLAALSLQRMSVDCDEIALEAEASNAGALRLYESLGFVREKLLAKYYLNGSSAFRMRAVFSRAAGAAPAPAVQAAPTAARLELEDD